MAITCVDVTAKNVAFLKHLDKLGTRRYVVVVLYQKSAALMRVNSSA